MKALHLCDNEELCWVNRDIERYPSISKDIREKGHCSMNNESYIEVYE